MSTLELGIIGNCSFAALVDRQARIVWCCLPRFDGDPVFHALLGAPKEADGSGVFSIDIEGLKSTEQAYVPNTALLRTVLHGEHGSVEIKDFAPRFSWRGRSFRPQTLVRRLKPISGSPRIAIRVRPRFDYGATAPALTTGSNHIRYVGPRLTMRLTTDAPLDYVLGETYFNLHEPVNLILGPDETLTEGAADTGRTFEEQTEIYWREWIHRLAIPSEWQDAVIRAAITLKLCTYEPTGAIVAAATTSIPEAPASERNWDYRYCWLRDSYFVVRALNSLSAVRTMENYFRWLMNIVAASDGHIQPVFGVGLERLLTERTVSALPGYRGIGPVRVGNQAHEHFQHDCYGNIVLGAAQAFLDRRLLHPPGHEDFVRLELVGERALKLYDQPDAGMWELRSRARVHTTSSLMCWAACDRLARIAAHIGEGDRARRWRADADRVRHVILERAWSDKRKAFVESFSGEHLDAGVLLMAEVGFIDASDPRFVSTLDAIERTMARGPYMMRYEAEDDFGLPQTAFNICAFWRVDALARIGRTAEAREHFEAMLAARNHLGLLSEDIDPASGELWGNFPQTYSMVGIINGAMRLSTPWEQVI
jgi:GH15 family glucan-1,4-alpha-glucosidase